MKKYQKVIVTTAVHAILGTVDSEEIKPYRAYIVHFVSLFKVLLSILHLNTIIAFFFTFKILKIFEFPAMACQYAEHGRHRTLLISIRQTAQNRNQSWVNLG